MPPSAEGFRRSGVRGWVCGGVWWSAHVNTTLQIVSYIILHNIIIIIIRIQSELLVLGIKTRILV